MLLHGPVVKDMVSYIESRGLVDWVLDKVAVGTLNGSCLRYGAPDLKHVPTLLTWRSRQDSLTKIRT